MSVTFALAASDPDGTIARIEWDFDGNGTVDQVTTTPSTTFRYETTRPTAIPPTPDALTGLAFDIGAGVPADQIALIKTGLAIGQGFLDSDLGGGIPDAVRKNVTVKIVATGRGNEEQDGGGACCTAFAASSATFKPAARVVDNLGATVSASTSVSLVESIIHPFFDVAHAQWNQSASRPVQLGFWTVTSGEQKTAIHEYTHSWQHHLGCIIIFDQPLGFWMNEGIAEYVAHEAMIKRGDMRRADVLDHMLFSARATGELSRPLRDFGGTTSDIWPGHVGYLALDRLVPAAPGGILALRTVCEAVAGGASVPSAFLTAFGIGLDDFYAQFEIVRQQIK